MKISSTKLANVYLLDLVKHTDSRGSFIETYHHERYNEFGIKYEFKQDNRVFSHLNVLRGIHYQIKKPFAQLVQVVEGKIFEVAVDLRPKSASFGQHIEIMLDANHPQQLLLAPGIAHGYLTLAKNNVINYKCSGLYDPNDEAGLSWKDPDLKINWPNLTPEIKNRDANYPFLKNIPAKFLPKI